MLRSSPYFGISVALLLAALFNFLFFDTHIIQTEETNSSIVITTPEFELAPLSVEPQEPILAETLVKEEALPNTESVPTQTIPEARVALVNPILNVPVEEPIGLDAAATLLREALVNIICYVPQGSTFHSISGSGVFIDPKGIILTNAHIAQYFLYKDREVSCSIRTGSPATSAYSAEPIFISPAWVNENADILTKTNPVGTGEHDYALLAVTKPTAYNSLPETFPFVSLASVPPTASTPVVIGSYGAQFLGANQIQSSLFPTIVFGSIKNVFTFKTKTIDVLELGGSAAAQQGSSGGGVVDASGELVGTIAISTIEGVTADRTLDAISASYVRAQYASETGEALDLLLARAPLASIIKFLPLASVLEATLVSHLP